MPEENLLFVLPVIKLHIGAHAGDLLRRPAVPPSLLSDPRRHI